MDLESLIVNFATTYLTKFVTGLAAVLLAHGIITQNIATSASAYGAIAIAGGVSWLLDQLIGWLKTRTLKSAIKDATGNAQSARVVIQGSTVKVLAHSPYGLQLSRTFRKGISCPCILLLALALSASLGGCSNQNASIHQAIIADDAAVVGATTLLHSHTINSKTATDVRIGATLAETAIRAWNTIKGSGDAAAVSSAQATAEQRLDALNSTVLTIHNSGAVSINPDVGSKRLRLPAAAPSSKKKVGEITAAIAIIQLVSDLAPPLVNWLNAALKGNTVTDADVQSDFVNVDQDLSTLQDEITAAIAQGR